MGFLVDLWFFLAGKVEDQPNGLGWWYFAGIEKPNLMKVIEFNGDILADLPFAEEGAVGAEVGYRYFVFFLADEAMFAT